MIKYFIRTTLERKLNESIGRELGEDYTLLVDTEHKPVESFIEQLSIISEYDSVLLEDDVILCRNFKQRIEEVISKYKDKVINFFTNPSRYFTTHITNEPFRFNQCTYYPKGLSEIISKQMKYYDKRAYKHGYDIVENLVLTELSLAYVICRPCLVQHIDFKSIIMGEENQTFRRTPYFIDYLEELGISYEDAWIKENKDRLTKLMSEHFNKK